MWPHRLPRLSARLGDLHPDETCVVQAGTASGVEISITSSFAQPARQDFAARFTNGEERKIERADDMVAMLQAFARMERTDPADAVRWRRNALVLETVQARIREQLGLS